MNDPKPRRKRSRRETPPQHADGRRAATDNSAIPPRQAYRILDRWIREQLRDDLEDLNSEVVGADSVIEIKLQLPIQLRLRGRNRQERRFAETLEREVSLIKDRVELERLGYRSGHVYCLWCRSPICEHSLPPDHRATFIGYDSTGLPCWKDFSSWIVDLRDARVERVFEEPPVPIAVYVSGPDLVSEVIADFRERSGTYHIVGQVCGGPFPLPRMRHEPSQYFALTLHLIERRTANGAPRYSLNLIASTPAPHHVPTLVAHDLHPGLSRLVGAAKQVERDLNQNLDKARRNGKRLAIKECRQLAQERLQAVPRALDKSARQEHRRTSHAHSRSVDPERPTASALSDARSANDEDLFIDRQQDTVIVRGPKHRVHVYTRDGRHVTSIVYPTRTVKERLRTRRWQPLDADELTRIRGALAKREGGGVDPDASDEPMDEIDHEIDDDEIDSGVYDKNEGPAEAHDSGDGNNEPRG